MSFFRSIVIATLFFHALQVHADPEEVVIGVEAGAYYPHYDTSTGEYEGFGRALLDAFADHTETKLVYKYQPLKRLVQSLLNGVIAIRYPDNPYWESDLKSQYEITYSNPIVSYVDGSVVKPARLGKGLESLKSLGTVAGFTAWPYFDLIRAGKINVSQNNSRTGLLHQVILGRVDAAYMSIVVANYQLAFVMEQPGALVFDPTLPYKKSHYYLSSIHRPDIVQRFNAFLRDEAGKINEIKYRFRVEEGLDFIPDYRPPK